MWRGYGKGSGSAAGKRSPVVAGPFRPPSDGSTYRNTNLWEPMTWLQYCGFKTSCPFKYKEYDLYKSIIIYLTKESFAHLWSWRFVFRWVRLVVRHLGAPLWMEWFFKATSFWRRGWVFSSSDWRISILPVSGNCFVVVHHDENFQLFYDRTKFNFADECLASRLPMQSAQFSGS